MSGKYQTAADRYAVIYGLYCDAAGKPCGRFDNGASPDGARLIAHSLSCAEHCEEYTYIPATSIRDENSLGDNQRVVLKALGDNGGWYEKDCGWVFRFHSVTVNVLRSLMRYGLVGWQYRAAKVFEITPFGQLYYVTYLKKDY